MYYLATFENNYYATRYKNGRPTCKFRCDDIFKAINLVDQLNKNLCTQE